MSKENVALRPSELVITAIHNLENDKGSSAQEIIRFILNKYNLPADQVEAQVEKALERGVNFGVLCNNNGCYYLSGMNNNEEKKRSKEKQTVKPKKKVTIKVPRKYAKIRKSKKPITKASTLRKKIRKVRKPLNKNINTMKKGSPLKIMKKKKKILLKGLQKKRLPSKRQKQLTIKRILP